MEVSRKSCRLCLNETEFNISLFSSYSRKTGLIDKILVCLKIPVDEIDFLTTICHQCTTNVEKYYDFIAFVKKSNARLPKADCNPRDRSRDAWELVGSSTNHVNQRNVTTYIREQVIDAADYSFSFMEMPSKQQQKQELKCSSPFFSNFSQPKQSQEPVWKTPKLREEKKPEKRDTKYKMPSKSACRPRHNSRDLFESQSQDVDDGDSMNFDWKLTPDDKMIKRLREKCFGSLDF